MQEAQKFLDVDGITTCYYEAGEGPVVVLLHSGEHGASAEITWERNFYTLANEYRVIAPDWLGYGKTDKLYDFVSGTQRRINHMQSFLRAMSVDTAHFVGSSMGGAMLLKALSDEPGSFPAASLTLIGAGGDSPDSAARRALIDYDCTFDGMRRVVEALFEDPAITKDESYIRRRLQLSLEPGAWECAAAARLKNPLVPPRKDTGQIDTTRYEALTLPVLVIAGDNDKIKEKGYGPKVLSKLPDGELYTVPGCGHMPNIESPELVNRQLLQFFERVDGAR